MNNTLQNPLQKKHGMHVVLLSFLLGMAGALAIFLPFLIVDKGFFLYAGDYNLQQIPFYMYVQQFIKTGGGTWSWATDIGSSAVNSYSFYNIGSPFLWLTMPFPSRWLPFMMVPLFMIKFGAIAAATSLYLSRYAKSRNMIVIVSLAYAFCGFNIYNIFFNHMLDPVAIFPLMLWAMDGFVYDKKRGFFAVMVGLALINNYFFFLGNVTFLLIYFFVKLYIGEYQITTKEFFALIGEAVLGVGLGMVLALPSFFNMVGNPRTSDFAYGFGMIQYGNVQQYFAIISSLFLPPDPPYMPNIFTEGAIKWTSMSAFMPILSVAGIAAYWKARKKSGPKILLGIMLVMALVPILNSSFYAFNASYYARWYYMPLLMVAFVTLRSLEDTDIDLLYGAKAALIGTGAYILFGLLPNKKDDVWVLGVAQDVRKFWLTYLTALLGAVVFYILVKYYRHTKRFAALLLGSVMGFSTFYSVIHLSLGKFPQWEGDKHFREDTYEAGGEITFPEGHFFRINAVNAPDNLGLWMNQSCLQTFNSVVTPSIMEFYPMVGVKRDVSSKPETDKYALRGLLSVEYTLVPKRERDNFENDAVGSLGWTYFKEQASYVMYENQNFIPLGFTYDTFVTMDNLWAINEEDRAGILVRAVGLEEDQVEEYSHLFSYELGNGYAPVSYDQYTKDAYNRRQTASYETKADASGFSCRIDMPQENLVFFGVPYDPGFSATVNGQKAEVLRVSGGMMAVLAPAGDNEIVFQYQTPGFRTGIMITLLSMLLLGAYLVLFRFLDKRELERMKAKALMQQESQAAELQQAQSLLPGSEELSEPSQTGQKDAEPAVADSGQEAKAENEPEQNLRPETPEDPDMG